MPTAGRLCRSPFDFAIYCTMKTHASQQQKQGLPKKVLPADKSKPISGPILLHIAAKKCYTKHGKRNSVQQDMQKRPQGSDLGAFLFPYGRQGLAPRLVAVFSTVKPFADVVANHTCQNGENERNSFQRTCPPSVPVSGAATDKVYHGRPYCQAGGENSLVENFPIK